MAARGPARLLLVVGACTAPVDVVAPPDAAGAQSAVITDEESGLRVARTLAWPTTDAILPASVGAFRRMLYAEPLADLGLGQRESPSCALLRPLATFRFGAPSDVPAELAPAEATDAELERLVPDRASRCFYCHELARDDVALGADRGVARRRAARGVLARHHRRAV